MGHHASQDLRDKFTLGGPARVPYNLPELLKRRDEEIVIVEVAGTNYLMSKGMLATCIQGQHWTSIDANVFVSPLSRNGFERNASGDGLKLHLMGDTMYCCGSGHWWIGSR